MAVKTQFCQKNFEQCCSYSRYQAINLRLDIRHEMKEVVFIRSRKSVHSEYPHAVLMRLPLFGLARDFLEEVDSLSHQCDDRVPRNCQILSQYKCTFFPSSFGPYCSSGQSSNPAKCKFVLLCAFHWSKVARKNDDISSTMLQNASTSFWCNHRKSSF